MLRYLTTTSMLIYLSSVQPVAAKSLWDKAGDGIRKGVRIVVPPKISCIQWTAHPLYIQMVVMMQDNKGELRRNGITDVNSCKNSRDTLTKIAVLKGAPLIAGITWDLGRCACERVF